MDWFHSAMNWDHSSGLARRRSSGADFVKSAGRFRRNQPQVKRSDDHTEAATDASSAESYKRNFTTGTRKRRDGKAASGEIQATDFQQCQVSLRLESADITGQIQVESHGDSLMIRSSRHRRSSCARKTRRPDDCLRHELVRKTSRSRTDSVDFQ